MIDPTRVYIVTLNDENGATDVYATKNPDSVLYLLQSLHDFAGLSPEGFHEAEEALSKIDVASLPINGGGIELNTFWGGCKLYVTQLAS